MSLLDEIIEDREAGTAGPWPLETVKTSCGVCHKVGQFESTGGRKGYSYACIYEDYPWTTPHKMSEPEANARRIARVPQLEQGYIDLRRAADELAEAIDSDRPRVIAAALTAYRTAIGEA